MSWNRFPLSAIFNFGNIQKSQGAMSGLYGSWWSCTILCFAKNCCTRFDECAGALSWWRSQSPLDQKRGRFLLTASRNLFRTSTQPESDFDEPFLNRLYHSFICVMSILSSTKAFCIISIVSVQLLPRLKQNLMQIHWSVLSVIFNCIQMRRTEKARWTYAARDPKRPAGNYGLRHSGSTLRTIGCAHTPHLHNAKYL